MSRLPLPARLPRRTRVPVSMMAMLSQAKNTREHGNGWQRILGGPVIGKAASTGSAVIEAIFASEGLCRVRFHCYCDVMGIARSGLTGTNHENGCLLLQSWTRCQPRACSVPDPNLRGKLGLVNTQLWTAVA